MMRAARYDLKLMAVADQIHVPNMMSWKNRVTGKRPRYPARATTKSPQAPMANKLPTTALCTEAWLWCHSLFNRQRIGAADMVGGCALLGEELR